MGWDDVYVLEPKAATAAGERPAHGRASPVAGLARACVAVREPAATVIDLSTSLRFRLRTFRAPGGRCARACAEARGEDRRRSTDLVLTSEDGVLAHLAAPEAAALWPDARSRARRRQRGLAVGRPTESGIERATTALDDVWYKPYDHGTDYEKHARDYLDWEVALVEQIKRDPTIRFRAFT